MGVVDTSTSQGYNICIQSPFGMLGIPLERYNRGVHILNGQVDIKPRLGPQKNPRSSGPKNIIENFQGGNLCFEPME